MRELVRRTRPGRGLVHAAAVVALAAVVAVGAAPPDLIFREPRLFDFFELPEDDRYVNTAVGDVDGDGRADVVVVGQSDAVRYLAGLPDGTVAASMTTVDDAFLGGTTGYAIFQVVDMDGDGDDDIAMDARFKAIHVLRNDGGGAFTGISADPGAEVLAGNRVLFDLGNDGDLDVLASVYSLPYVTDPGYRVFENLGDSFAPGALFLFPVGAQPRLCDLDGNGLDDVVVVHPAQLVVLRQTAAGALVADPPVPHGTGAQGAAVIDIEGDGDQDVLAYGRMLRNDGTGALAEDAALFTSQSFALPVVVDFDNDGLEDVVDIGTGVVVNLFRNTGGALAAPVALPSGLTLGNGVRFAIEDVDEDGKPDLALMNYSANTMSILRQAGAPAPTDLEVAPDAILRPGSVSLDLTGTGFLDGATADFGPGIAVTGVVVSSGSEATALLSVDPGIGGGERIVRFTNPDRQVVQSSVEVRSLDAEAASGRLLDSPAPARDVLRVKGRLPRNGLSANGAFAGRDEGLRLEIGAGPSRLVVDAPALDPRWREAARGRRLVFETLPDEFPRVRIAVDLRRERFDLEVSFFDYPQAPADASLGVFSGDDLGRDAAGWTPRRDGFRYRLR